MKSDIVERRTKSIRSDFVYIRVLATFLVLLGHSWFFQGYVKFSEPCLNENITPNCLLIFNKAIYTFHMQIFFALSGALFYLSFKKHPIVDFNRLLKTKFRRLIIPFGVIGLLYLIPVYYLIGHNNGISFKEVLVHTLFNVEWGHIWFMPTLFWLMIYGCLIFKITPPHHRHGQPVWQVSKW